MEWGKEIRHHPESAAGAARIGIAIFRRDSRCLPRQPDWWTLLLEEVRHDEGRTNGDLVLSERGSFEWAGTREQLKRAIDRIVTELVEAESSTCAGFGAVMPNLQARAMPRLCRGSCCRRTTWPASSCSIGCPKRSPQGVGHLQHRT